MRHPIELTRWCCHYMPALLRGVHSNWSTWHACRNHKMITWWCVLSLCIPNEDFWKAEPTFQNAFSKYFSTFRGPNSLLTPLKSASKTLLDCSHHSVSGGCCCGARVLGSLTGCVRMLACCHYRCMKQHFRDLPTPYWASPLAKSSYYPVCMTRS